MLRGKYGYLMSLRVSYVNEILLSRQLSIYYSIDESNHHDNGCILQSMSTVEAAVNDESRDDTNDTHELANYFHSVYED